MLFCPSTKYETRSIKFAKYTNTCTHSQSRKEETESSTRSEWRTNFTSPLCRLNNLTYSMSCYSTPSRLLSLSLSLSLVVSCTHSLWYTLRVTEALCHPGWRFKEHREPSKDTDTETPVYTVYIHNLLQTFFILWHAYRRTEGPGVNYSQRGLETWQMFGKCSGSVFVGGFR